ncbi:MAG: peptidyl-prolyl cis-trans isomerase [Pseudomonadota bacterium]|nr:peptidyl-prolyl cis-trans isomerase [Pseudomonadota bacterium]
MRKLHRCAGSLLLTVLVGTFLLSCSPPEEVVATIDGKAITRAEVNARLKGYREERTTKTTPQAVQQNQFSSAKAVLNQLINEHLLLLEARRQNLINDTENRPLSRQAAIQKVLHRFGKEVPFPNLKDAREYYKQHAEEFVAGPRYQLEHLLLSSEHSACKLKELLEKGKITMREAGIQQIAGARVANSGKNRLITAEELPPSLTKILPGLKPKVISPVIATPYGYHLVRVERRLPAGEIPFPEVENQIKDTLFAQRLQSNYQHWLKQSKEQHTIKIFHQHLADL